MRDESPTSANLGNDHQFIIKEYYLNWFVESGQDHTIPVQLAN